MDIATLVSELCEREWQMFSQVQNAGGPASCQQEEAFFKKMRACQFMAWSGDMLMHYLEDLIAAEACERNLPMEKYAWMMEHTHPQEFAGIRDSLPDIPPAQLGMIAEIVRVLVDWEAEVDSRFPHVRAGGRALRKEQDTPYATSFETYLEGELKTYSQATIASYLAHVREIQNAGGNMAMDVAEYTAKAYGFASLNAMEEHQAAKQRG